MVIMGKNIGFCNGVNNSINEAIKLINEKEKVYSLGMIIHNENVIKELEQKGIIFVDDINKIPDNSEVIFRAHGVTKEIYIKAKNKNLKIHDLTCPNVLKIHKIVKELNEKGYYIILYGKETHPEVIGIMSYCKGKVINKISDIENIENKKIAFLSQTTMDIDTFKNLGEELIKKYPNIKIYNTICNSTKKREEEVKVLSNKVDNLLVVGSNKSSNTKKLYNISKCKNTYLVDDIENFNIKLKGKIGIVTGASCRKEDAIKLRKKYE